MESVNASRLPGGIHIWKCRKKRGKMRKQAILSPKLSKPVGVFSHALKAEGKQFLFISGLTARDINGNPVGKGDMRAQTKQVLENMKITKRRLPAVITRREGYTLLSDGVLNPFWAEAIGLHVRFERWAQYNENIKIHLEQKGRYKKKMTPGLRGDGYEVPICLFVQYAHTMGRSKIIGVNKELIAAGIVEKACDVGSGG